jgi:hypothetical protein
MNLDVSEKSADSERMASAAPPKYASYLGRSVSLSLGTSVAFVAVNLLLVGGGLLALRQNVELRSVIAADETLLTPAKGTLMPALLGRDRIGATQNITFGQDRRPTLFYSFEMECPHCRENWRAMRALQALAPNLLRIIYIDIAQETLTPEYLTSSGIGQSVALVRLLPPVATAYDARAVPLLLMVDSDGQVQWSHMGELSATDVSKAVSFVKRD